MAKLGGYYYSKKRDRGLSSYAKKMRKMKKRSIQSLGKTKPNFGVSLRGKTTLIALLIAVIICAGILFFSNFFAVKKAVLVGNNKIKSEDIESILKDAISGNRFVVFSASNIMLINDGKIKNKIMEEMPLIDRIEIKRMLPNTLKLNIPERDPFAIWETGGKKYLVDSKGKVCYEIKDNVNMDLPIIYDKQNKAVEVKGEATFPQQINVIRNILNSLKDKTKLEVEFVSLPNSLGFEVDVKTKDGFMVYFNTERSVDSQIRDLKSVLDKQVAEQKSSLQYIDLRVENWVYYK